ncbi:hypothetical protein TNCV_3823661 [Trichonephila clavipes]|nr:hypothetical protein TNCV_3823661 [Trichonephila clavipes]
MCIQARFGSFRSIKSTKTDWNCTRLIPLHLQSYLPSSVDASVKSHIKLHEERLHARQPASGVILSHQHKTERSLDVDVFTTGQSNGNGYCF